MQTIITACSCQHEFQDANYGKNQRVMNQASKKGAFPKNYRCTVCGKDKTVGNIQ